MVDFEISWSGKSVDPLILRIAARHLEAKEFSTPKALRDYLHEHPNADKTKRHVRKPEQKPTKPQESPAKSEEHEESHGEHETPKKSWGDHFKSLSKDAKSLFQEAPKAVKKFFEDEGHRRKVLTGAADSLANLPKNAVKSVVATVKKEVEEYQEAAEGVKAVLKGGKMSHHQKKALRTCAFHIGLTVAAATLTVSGGPFAFAGAVGKSLARHVAMKSAAKALGHIHVLSELGEIGHSTMESLSEVFDKLAADKKLDPDEILVRFVSALMSKEMGNLSNEDLAEALEAESKKGKEKTANEGSPFLRVAARYLRAKDPSDKANTWLLQAGKDVESFFTDPKARKKGLTKAVESLKEDPSKAGREAVAGVKDHFGAEAFEGVKAAVGGGSLTDSQKTALKDVAYRTAAFLTIGALVKAFPSSVAYSVVGKNIARKVAKKVLAEVLGLKNTKTAGDPETEELLGTTLAVAVSDTLEKLSDEDIQEILEASAADSV